MMVMIIMMITSSDLEELSPSSPLLAADVFLLCFSIADHASLYTALDHWLPLLKVISVMVVLMDNADNAMMVVTKTLMIWTKIFSGLMSKHSHSADNNDNADGDDDDDDNDDFDDNDV